MKAILLLLLVPLVGTAYGQTTQDMTVTVPFAVHDSWTQDEFCNLYINPVDGRKICW